MAATAQQGSPEYQAAVSKSAAAEQALLACLRTTDACDTERQAYWLASDEVETAISNELRANATTVEQATRGLRDLIDRINQCVACRRAKHWWQIWKRCGL
jgi:hypothetical protein